MYIYIYVCVRVCVSTLRKQVLQLHKLGWYSCASLMAAPCAEWYIALQPRSMLFSGFLHTCGTCQIEAIWLPHTANFTFVFLLVSHAGFVGSEQD